MADKTSTLELAGVPLGALAVIVTVKEWSFSVTLRNWAYVNIYAVDGANNPIGFQWSNATAGTYNVVPSGMAFTLPVFQTQSYFFKYLTGNCSLYGTCVG